MPYSFWKEPSHLHQERPWVFIFGALLAATAGFVNVVLLEIYHVPVSHMSGAVSRMAVELTAGNGQDLPGALSIFCAFLAGAILSGVVIGSVKLQPGRRYGVAMMIEGGLLTLATWLLMSGRQFGIPVAAMACGLQNGMASSYCGLILRTTHVTGLVTDIGVMLGQWLRYRRIEFWKLVLLVMLLTGFFAGGWLGGWLFTRVGIAALLLVAAGVSLAGLLYFDWRRRHLRDFPLDRWGYFPPGDGEQGV
jgi:uncharacterized membrane protein YoaK (UPF0700 family)